VLTHKRSRRLIHTLIAYRGAGPGGVFWNRLISEPSSGGTGMDANFSTRVNAVSKVVICCSFAKQMLVLSCMYLASLCQYY